MNPPQGVWAASLTPLSARLDADLDLLTEHTTRLLEDGCDGIVLFGTTGEAASFSVAERRAALEGLLDRGFDPSRLMVGTGCAALTDTVDLTQHALSIGVDRVLIIPPFFVKEPPPVGVWDSYREIIERVGSPNWQLFLYNFPKLSGVPITADLVHSLREFHGEIVVGIKDSSGEITSLHNYLSVPGFSVMPGTERLLVEGFRLGAAGVITATANINATGIATVFAELTGGSAPDDRAMLSMRGIVERYGTIPAMKSVLARRSGYEGWSRLRPPLIPLTGANDLAVNEEMAVFGS